VRIHHAQGVHGAANAKGVAVVIDVFRAFTVSAYALANGAERCLVVKTVEEARALHDRIPRSVLSAEVDGLPVPGIPLSNSPTAIAECDLHGRVLVQRTSAGTQCVAAVKGAETVLAASLVLAKATARKLQALNPPAVTLVASGELDHLEDQACARYLEAMLQGKEPDLDELLWPLKLSERYARLRSGAVPGFPPSDITLALAADRFDFVMPVRADEGHYELVAEPA
jgi:2-phosphosulfolactate phosphatase